MKRRLICCVLTIAMCLGMISCSQTSDVQSGTTEEQNSTAAQSSTEASDTSEALSSADNPSLLIQSLDALYESGKITSDNNNISMEAADHNGILICGASEQLNETRFLIDNDFDFGTSRLQRIMVCGLGEKDMVTQVSIYLDGAAEPSAVITLPASEEKDFLAQNVRNANEIVTAQNITGRHRVEFSVCQSPEAGDNAASADARVLLTGIQFVAESIPLINIRIDESQGTIAAMNDDPEHETACHGEMDILLAEDYACDLSEDYSGGTYVLDYMKGRGNSSWKKEVRRPYKLKLAEAENLFGMGEEKSWALLANFYDDTLMHNAFTYQLGELLELPFTPQFVPVDVVLNGEYLGNYMLIESIRLGESRIAIDDLDDHESDTDITGGYLLSSGSGGVDEDIYSFKTQQSVTFNIESPCDTTDPDYEAEIAYIEEYVQRIENALYGEPDPVTGQVEDPFSLMDLDSAVRYYLIQELSANCDFLLTGSTYCYKLRDGKLYWGPLWDFDIAWNDASMYSDAYTQQQGWFERMFYFEEFSDAVKSYYVDTLAPAMDALLSEDGYAKTYYDAIRYSAINNFTLWGIGTETPEVLKSWKEKRNTDALEYGVDEIKRIYENKFSTLIETVGYRVQWCKDNLDSLRGDPVKVRFMVEDEVVATADCMTGFAVYPFADAPVVGEGRFFGGWYYKGLDEDGNTIKCPMTAYDDISPDSIETVDGEQCLRLYADIRDERLSITSLRFQQTSYNLPYEPMGMYILPLEIHPFDGYDDLIAWSVDDSSVVVPVYGDKQLYLMIMGEGTAVVSATLHDGTVYSITVNVKEVPEGSDSAEFAVTDFRLSDEQLTLAEGDQVLVGIEVVAPEEYLNVAEFMGTEYIWSVVSGDACSVREDGIITAEHAGTAVLVCTHTITSVSRTVTVEVI